MNSTVQCLHSVPELKSALVNYSHSGRNNDVDQTSHMLTVATRDLFGELDKSVKPVAPMQFWMVLRKKYPQFGQLHNGVFMQQDAEECWTQLLYTLSQSLRSLGSSESMDTVKDLFGIELASRIHCQESCEESSETESVYSLKCHISQEVNHLHEGLKHVVVYKLDDAPPMKQKTVSALKSELEKASPALGRSAIYLKESRINGLPRYLTIQFVRFFWKRESNQKAKILRKVDYPLELDIYDLCSDELRKQLEGPRQILRNNEGGKLGLKANEKISSSKDDDVKMTGAEGSSNASGESSVTISQEGVPSEKETRLTGIYDLVAVLTHKGRSADSGHYVAWVKQESGKWIEFDDDNPIPQREEDIVKLSGGANTNVLNW
ncbi:Ubiquitin carboxyl-terminal hydrolase 6 [Hibiscus syriacus]|uniref:ubiquitinyl hydrolase 1 n=1 Tax=Hibiscus syriacus TaxID=106335 RepID=A0A6A3CY30_HIBSY|nr:Ubiquitin carboxyl-terminal hydrolase 6 [Hibiscus syriacus]